VSRVDRVADDYRRLKATLRARLRRRPAMSDEEFDDAYQEAWIEVVKRSCGGRAVRTSGRS
jgi:DNA-directed RNA polymerase specialized sigma24 family protein